MRTIKFWFFGCVIPFVILACDAQDPKVKFHIEYLNQKKPEVFVASIGAFPYESPSYNAIMGLPDAVRMGWTYEQVEFLNLIPDIAVKSSVSYGDVGQVSYVYTYVSYKEAGGLDDARDEGVSLYFSERRLVMARVFYRDGRDEYFGDTAYINDGVWLY